MKIVKIASLVLLLLLSSFSGYYQSWNSIFDSEEVG